MPFLGSGTLLRYKMLFGITNMCGSYLYISYNIREAVKTKMKIQTNNRCYEGTGWGALRENKVNVWLRSCGQGRLLQGNNI